MRTKGKQPTRGKLHRFVGASLRNKIDRMYMNVDRHHKLMIGILDKINEDYYRVMHGDNRKFKKHVEKNSQSMDKHTHTINEVFLTALKEIGRPALTKEIAHKIEESKTKEAKKLTKNNNFMQIIYNSASNLSKHGDIQRKPHGKKSYEYSLKSWKGTHVRKSA